MGFSECLKKSGYNVDKVSFWKIWIESGWNLDWFNKKYGQNWDRIWIKDMDGPVASAPNANESGEVPEVACDTRNLQ